LAEFIKFGEAACTCVLVAIRHRIDQ